MNAAIAPQTLDLAPLARIVDAGNTSPEACRVALHAGRDAVHVAFEQGVPASSLMAGRTAVVDLVLTRLWFAAGNAFDGLALCAVGGYGRGELEPASDIDLAILLPEDTATSQLARDEQLSAWITALWDLQLQIGHSVRTVAESATEAAADITVVTNLMEARLLAGDAHLLDQMREAISPERMWPAEEFYHAKLDEQAERRAKFGANAYRLEPNVKESEGGLRDFQTIAWICQRAFGRDPGSPRVLAPLVDSGVLESAEIDSLNEGLELLWRIRYLLHHYAGRTEDRLLFDYQRRIAEALGYGDGHNDTPGNHTIEALMQEFYRTLMGLQGIAEICLQGIGGVLSGVTAASDVVPINRRFQLRNGFLETTEDTVFFHYPAALLEIFRVFSNNPGATRIRSSTVRQIRAHLKLINHRFRTDPAVKKHFISLFDSQQKLTETLRLMNRYGVLAAYLPAFDAIVGRMQYDLFHIYTVDEHTLRVIQNLRRLTIPEHADELPHCSSVMERIEQPRLLYLVALFHDIAKGRGGDHSVLGAADIQEFAQSHGFSPQETALMSWTVRHHLDMSMTAQSRDIDDPDVQLDFARSVGTLERLDYLYLLTVADIRSTNPELWNSFKQSLLQALYRHTRLILERGLDAALEADRVIANRQAQTRTMLDQTTASSTALESLWASFGEDYFRQHQASDIAHHTMALLASSSYEGQPARPLVTLRDCDLRGCAELLIHTDDDMRLFARITTLLETLELNVLSATICTTALGHALDSFYVLERNGGLIEGETRREEIKGFMHKSLLEARRAPSDLPASLERRASRRLKHFDIDTKVEFADRDDGQVEVRITAGDRPGILSRIGRLLADAGIAVHAARIATLGERIDDIFFVSMADGSHFDADIRATLANTITQEI